jgi:hypothetical protein
MENTHNPEAIRIDDTSERRNFQEDSFRFKIGESDLSRAMVMMRLNVQRIDECMKRLRFRQSSCE